MLRTSRSYFYRLMTDQVDGIAATGLKGILGFLAVVYGFLTRLWSSAYNRGFFPSYRLSKPVISVGNITWGGAGKTPLVILITKFIQTKGLRPVILLRGYKSQRTERNTMVNDEAMLLEEALNVPVVTGKNRVHAAMEALNKYPVDIFLLDDGFQHWRMKRDLDIVVVDATNPFGNGQLIPRGILRESLAALFRADLFVLTKSDVGKKNVERIKAKLRSRKDVSIVETIHQPEALEDLMDKTRWDLNSIKDKPVVAFCSIGDPTGFEHTLRQLGAQVKKVFCFDDHYWYRQSDLQTICDYCKKEKIQILVTTAKDAVKLKAYMNLFERELRCLVLKIKIQVTKGEDELFRRITSVLQR